MCISDAWQTFCKGYDSCIGQCRWNEQEETEISLWAIKSVKKIKKKNSFHLIRSPPRYQAQPKELEWQLDI